MSPDEIETEIENLKAEIGRIEDRLPGLVDVGRHESLQNEVGKLYDRLNDEVASWREFSRGTKYALEQFEASLSETMSTGWREEFRELVKRVEENLGPKRTELEQLTEMADLKVNEINSTAEQMKRLGVAVASGSSSTGFGTAARQHGKAEFWWSIVACVTFLAWAVLAGAPLVISLVEQWSGVPRLLPGRWEDGLMRFVGTLPLFMLAGFAGLQAGNHAKAQRIMRQRELEFAAINPFVGTLNEEAQREILAELARKLFGGRSEAPEVQSSESVNVLKKILACIKKSPNETS